MCAQRVQPKGENIRFVCLCCDHIFFRKTIPESMEVRCPKCGEYDVDIT